MRGNTIGSIEQLLRAYRFQGDTHSLLMSRVWSALRSPFLN